MEPPQTMTTRGGFEVIVLPSYLPSLAPNIAMEHPPGWWVLHEKKTCITKCGRYPSQPSWVTGCFQIASGWWFGTFFIFPYIGNNHSNWLIFFRGVQTTNQAWCCIYDMFFHRCHNVVVPCIFTDRIWRCLKLFWKVRICLDIQYSIYFRMIVVLCLVW